MARASKIGVSWLEDGIPPTFATVVNGPGSQWSSLSAITHNSDGSTWMATQSWLGRLDASGRMTPMYQPWSAQLIGLVSGRAGVTWELRRFEGEDLGSEVLRITGSDQMRIPLAGIAGGIAGDREGGVWVALLSPSMPQVYTDPSGQATTTFLVRESRVVHIAVDGSVTEVPVSDPVRYPDSPELVQEPRPIALGADGNLWLVEHEITPSPQRGKSRPFSTRIVRLSPTGVVRRWPMGTRAIRGLSAGPGGIWFTADEQTIGRVGYSGRIIAFSDHLARSRPGEIVAGPHETMWFTERGFNALGSVDARGVVRQHTWDNALARGNDYAGAIASGSDGTLWFYRPYFNDLGRVSLRPECNVPRLAGMTIPRAVVRLRRAGCHVGTITGRDGRARRAVIVAQHPLAGVPKALGTAVNLRVQAPILARLQCVPSPGERDVVHDANAVVLAKLQRPRLVEFRVCRMGHGSIGIGHSESEEVPGSGSLAIQMPTLAGRYLAWRTSYGDRYTDYEGLMLLNVETGQKSSFEISPQDAHLVNEIALDPSGRLAWQRTFNRSFDSSMYEVQACTHQGVVTLETSPVASLEGLSFDGDGHLTWTNGGVKHSVALAPCVSQ